MGDTVPAPMLKGAEKKPVLTQVGAESTRVQTGSGAAVNATSSGRLVPGSWTAGAEFVDLDVTAIDGANENLMYPE